MKVMKIIDPVCFLFCKGKIPKKKKKSNFSNLWAEIEGILYLKSFCKRDPQIRLWFRNMSTIVVRL